MRALKEYENVKASAVLGKRQTVRTGKVVSDFINDGAAMTKRLFVRLTPERKRMAQEKFKNPIEADKCFRRLRTTEDKAVLRFCYCNGKYRWSYLLTMFIILSIKWHIFRYKLPYKQIVLPIHDSNCRFYTRVQWLQKNQTDTSRLLHCWRDLELQEQLPWSRWKTHQISWNTCRRLIRGRRWSWRRCKSSLLQVSRLILHLETSLKNFSFLK